MCTETQKCNENETTNDTLARLAALETRTLTDAVKFGLDLGIAVDRVINLTMEEADPDVKEAILKKANLAADIIDVTIKLAVPQTFEEPFQSAIEAIGLLILVKRGAKDFTLNAMSGLAVQASSALAKLQAQDQAQTQA